MRLIGRPLAVFCAAFMISCAAGYLFSEYIVFIVAAAGALSLLSLLLFAVLGKNGKGRIPLLLLVSCIFFVIGAVRSYSHFSSIEAEISGFYNHETTIKACCVSVESRTSFNARYVVDTLTADGKSTRMRLLLSTSGEVIAKGEIFTASVSMRPLSEDLSGYDEAGAYKGRGVWAAASTVEGSEVSVLEEKDHLAFALASVSKAVTGRFDLTLSARGSAFFSAVFAGDRSYMSEGDIASVRRSGTSHLLAVSGMHFSVIMGMAYFFVSSLGLSVRSRYVLLSIGALAYAGFTGFSPPVVRSGIMLLLTYAAAVAGKRTDPLTSLLGAGALMLGVCPYYLLSPSFWLSFSATLGVVMLSSVLEELFERRHKKTISAILSDTSLGMIERISRAAVTYASESLRALPSFLVGSVTVSIAASAFSMPFCILFYGSVSYAALPAGIVLSGIVSAALVSAPAVIAFGGALPVSAAASALGEAFFTTTRFFSSIDGVYANVDYPVTKAVLLLLLLAALSVMLVTKGKLIPLLLCAVGVMSVFGTAHIAESIEFAHDTAIVRSTGESDVMLLRSDIGLIVADMGSDGVRDIDDCMAAAAQLKENDIGAYIFTSLNTRSANTARYLVQGSSVGCIYLPDYAALGTSVLANAVREEAQRAGVAVEVFRFGEEFSVGGYRMCVSELEYLDRSVRALYSVSAVSDEGSVLWMSGAYLEGEKCASLKGKSYDRIVFGIYGPKYKKKLTDQLNDVECGEYIAVSESISEFVSENGRVCGALDGASFSVCESVRFTFLPDFQQK